MLSASVSPFQRYFLHAAQPCSFLLVLSAAAHDEIDWRVPT